VIKKLTEDLPRLMKEFTNKDRVFLAHKMNNSTLEPVRVGVCPER
jgi:hypothetical protein